MSLEDILEKINKDGETRKAEIVSRAREEAEKIMEEGKREAGETEERFVKEAEKRASQMKHREEVLGQLEARKIFLSEKVKIVEEIYRETFQRIRNLSSEEQRDIFKRLILSQVITGREEIVTGNSGKSVLDSKFIKKINEELSKTGKKGALTLRHDPGTETDGFILKREKVEVNDSWENILSEIKDRTMDSVTQILFGRSDE